jgi:hypothetical protein
MTRTRHPNYEALFYYDSDEDITPLEVFLKRQVERTWEKVLERERRRGG